MGSVYVAHDPRLARDVALKVLSSDLAQKPEHRERFFAEARSCSALNHPNITTIHEIGEADGVHFIAFELVEGKTLESILDRDVRLAPERVVDIALALSGALAYAHDRGIVHRDLKPANVVVSELGVPKILDFGLAKTMPGALGAVGPESETMVRLTQAGMVVGTIAYMAPEPGARSDRGCSKRRFCLRLPPVRDARRGAAVRGSDRHATARSPLARRAGARRRATSRRFSSTSRCRRQGVEKANGRALSEHARPARRS